MFIKQVDQKTALELAAKGKEIKVLVPTGRGNGWESMEPDTLQNMLANVMFFRSEPAMETDLLKEEKPEEQKGTSQKQKTNTGRLIEFPCKIGDEIYWLIERDSMQEDGYFISKNIVTEVGVRGFWISGHPGETCRMDIFSEWTEIGKTIFLTEQEALKALGYVSYMR